MPVYLLRKFRIDKQVLDVWEIYISVTIYKNTKVYSNSFILTLSKVKILK